MIIKDNTVRFTESDNPVKNLLSEKAQALVPADYAGTNKSELLANLYSQKLENGSTVAELSLVALEVSGEQNLLVQTQAIVKRLTDDSVDVKRGDFISTFYSLSEYLNFENQENAYYLVELYNTLDAYHTNLNLGSTVRHLYSLKKGRDENGRIPSAEIRKYILLNKALRAEGIVLPATEVFYCSLAWSEGEVFNLIERGLSLSDALKMYEVGFKTIDEIVEYGGSVPASWIDAILSD